MQEYAKDYVCMCERVCVEVNGGGVVANAEGLVVNVRGETNKQICEALILKALLILPSKTVESTALSLQCIHHVHSSNSFPASMLSVGYCITNNVFEKDLEDASCLLVDETADTLNTASPRQTADGRLCDSLDVVSENFTSFPIAYRATRPPNECATNEIFDTSGHRLVTATTSSANLSPIRSTPSKVKVDELHSLPARYRY
ncbi:hypothetical protein LXL04_018058 [Taraxacum kok-saghyz]